MDARHVYDLLQEACRNLESADQHAIAAYVSQAMAMISLEYHVGQDHLEL